MPDDKPKFSIAARMLSGLSKKDPKAPAEAAAPAPKAEEPAAPAAPTPPPAIPAKASPPPPQPAGIPGGLIELAEKLHRARSGPEDPEDYELLDDVRPEKLLRKGFQTPAVKILQRELKRLGFAAPQHGKFDFDTELAVRRFQRRVEIKETGKVCEATLTALDIALGLNERKRFSG